MFYDTFTELCKENDIAPSALARRLGMSASAPGRWKNGSAPDLITAGKIADFFGVSIDYLVGKSPSDQSITAENSVVMQGNRGNNTVAYGHKPADDGLSDMEKELLRIFRSLDMRHKNSFMSYAYSVEDEMKGMNSKE